MRLALFILLIAGCRAPLVVTCTPDTEKTVCVRSDKAGGVCRPDPVSGASYCAFPDGMGGFTWDQTAGGGLAGKAVDTSNADGSVDGPRDAGGTGPLTWTVESTGTMTWLFGVWAALRGEAWAVGLDDKIFHYTDAAGWRTGANNKPSLYAIWGSRANDVFAVGAGAIQHFDGNNWSAQTDPDLTMGNLNAVWGSSANDVFAVGDAGLVLHSDGSGVWMQQAVPDPNIKLLGVWGNATATFVVGEGSTILRQDAGHASWTPLTSDVRGEWSGVWGSDTDLFIVGSISGAAGIIHSRTNGSSFDAPQLPMTSAYTLGKIWGTGSDLYAVGQSGVMLHSRGGITWELVPTPLVQPDMGTLPDLYSVWGTGPNDVFVVGYNGTILHGR